jgi:hypothetical protein
METTFEALRQTRRNFLALLEGHSLATPNLVPGGYNNNLIWNLGHVLVSQQLLVYRPTGVAMHIDAAIIEKYRRGTKPDGKAGSGDFALLRDLAMPTIDALEADYAGGKFATFEPYKTGFGVQLNSVEVAIQFVPVHEALHLGYAMALKRMLS